MRMDIRTSTSSQMKDLAKRPLSVSSGIVESLKDASQPCKVIAARVMAAQAILKAASGSGTHLEQVLDRTEGKVGGNLGELGSGNTFVFNLIGSQPQLPGSAGEVIQGVLASQAINPINPSQAHDTPVTQPPKRLTGRGSPDHALDEQSIDEGYQGSD